MKYKNLFGSLRVIFFITLFTTITMLMILVFSGLSYWVNTFYYQQKIEILVEEADNLIDDLKEKKDIDEMYSLIDSYQEKNDAIFDYSFIYAFIEEDIEMLTLNLESSEGKHLFVNVDRQMLDARKLETLYDDDKMRITGEITNKQIMPFKINDVFLYNMNEDDLASKIENGSKMIEDDYIVTSIEIAEVLYENNLDVELDWFYENYVLEATGELNKHAIYYIFNNPSTNFKELIVEYHFEIEQINQVIYIQSSQQSVDQFIEMLKPFAVRFFIIGLIIALVITIVMSSWVTKPIRKITKKADQVAKLEFTDSLQYRGYNELSILAKSINTMSDNLQKSLEELEQSNKELLESLEKEKRIEKQRREFISNASHEMKTPLSVAKGYIEAVKDGVRSDRRDEYIDISLEEIDRVNEIVMSLLELIRNEHEEEMKDLSLANIESVIESLIAYFHINAIDKNMTIKKCGSFCEVFYERKSFRTVMSNLLSNAIKYGKENSCINVEGIVDEEILTIIVNNEVEDIEEIDTEKIWEKFYTVELSHSDESSGTGLGLPIVKSILERYHSNYHVRKIGNRLEFSFTLNRTKKKRNELYLQ